MSWTEMLLEHYRPEALLNQWAHCVAESVWGKLPEANVSCRSGDRCIIVTAEHGSVTATDVMPEGYVVENPEVDLQEHARATGLHLVSRLQQRAQRLRPLL